MKELLSRLRKLEKLSPKPKPDILLFDEAVREQARRLNAEEARFCLWTIRYVNDDEIYEGFEPSDHRTPNGSDIARANELLPDLCLHWSPLVFYDSTDPDVMEKAAEAFHRKYPEDNMIFLPQVFLEWSE